MGKKGNKTIDYLAWQWTEKNDASVSDHDLKSAYRLLLPKCNTCRKNTAGNPCCLHGLGASLWAKPSLATESEDYLKNIEKELNEGRRADGELVGLQNLGATCYVNTYLQLWFYNIDFRRAIYDLEDHASTNDNGFPQTICGQLQLMFGLLQNSFSKSVDPTSFINCLGLPKNLQQDAQEFSKLFMCLLETTPGLSQVIQSQFSGKYAYVTKCLKCNSVVETPAKFYELDLHIQGHKDLKSALMDFLKEEQLEKDNQYFCDVCLSKQDAVRQIVLKELPPTLSIQLLRFVYDRATQRKHKVNTNLSFPETLDFSAFVTSNENDNSSMIYHLSAVLLHRGLLASSGHYVAHIKDPTSNSWFQFNDEVVAKIRKGKKLDLGSSNADDDIWNDVAEGSPPKKAKMAKGRHSSKDVYMLVYTKNTKNVDKNLKVPESIARFVNEANSRFEASIAENYTKAQQLHKEKLELESKMRNLVELLQKDFTIGEWIPTAGLKDYLNHGKLTAAQPTLTSKFLCSHGNLSLSSLNLLKYIPKTAADVIFAGNEKAFRLNNELCRECVYSHCMLLQGKRKVSNDSLIVGETLEVFENNPSKSSVDCYYVGRLSFRKWKVLALKNLKKKYELKSLDQVEANDELSSDQSDLQEQFKFNSDLLCSHKNLTMNLNTALVVPKIIWDILLNYFPDSHVFSVETCVQCSICLNDARENEEAIQSLKLTANEQKNALYQLYMNKSRPVYPTSSENNVQKSASERYYIVSGKFVDAWRDFIRSPTKCSPVCAIKNSVFLCRHEMLLYDLPSYLSVPMDLKCDMNKNSLPPCVMLWENEWNFIKENFEVDFPIYVEKRNLKPCAVVLKKIDPSLVTSLINFDTKSNSDAEMSSNDLVGPSVLIKSGDSENFAKSNVDISIHPCLCLECIRGLAVEEKKKLQVYDDADIYVLKSTKSVLEMVQSISCSSSDKEECTSLVGQRNSRSRRCARGEKKLSNISSNLTLQQLKIKIMGLFSIPPFDQNLWLNNVFLSDNTATIGSLNIIPGSTLTLIGDLPNPDDVPFVCETTKSEPEVGFLGTNLIGHLGS